MASENQFSNFIDEVLVASENLFSIFIMLSPRQVLDTYYLEARRDLLEIAALLDRYDAAVEREGAPADDEETLDILRRALAHLADSDSPSGERTAALLTLFSEI